MFSWSVRDWMPLLDQRSLNEERGMVENRGLVRLALRLALMVESDDAEVRLLLSRARTAIKQGDDREQALLADELTRCCLARVGEGEHRAAPSAAEGASPRGLRRLFGRRAGDAREPPALQSLAPVVERIAVQVERLHGQPDRAARIRGLLAGLDHASSLSILSSGLISELDAVEHAALQHTQRTTSVLDHFSAQLDSFEASLSGLQVSSGEAYSRSEQLTRDVDTDVSDLGNAAPGADIDGLREMVEQRISSIRGNLLRYLAEERRQHEATQQQLSELTRQVQDMERESAQLRSEVEQKTELAMRDPLTGVHNRTAFELRADGLLEECRQRGMPLSVGFVDCNRFKQINDTFGHAAGDLVLNTVAEVLVSRARSSDFVCRYGGDEFVLLLPDTPARGAEALARDIYRLVSERNFNDDGRPVEVTVSLGLTEARPEDSLQTLLQRADQAMYTAKKQEPEQIVVLK